MNDYHPDVPFSWPAGHRAALCPVILFDTPGEDPGGAMPTGIDYAPSGLARLLNVLADLDVTATVGVTSAAERFAPTLVARAANSNLEVARWEHHAHQDAGVHPATGDSSGGLSRGLVAGLPHSPAFTHSGSGKSWIIDGSGGDRPTSRGQCCVIPTSPYWVDSVWLDPHRPLPPSSFLEAWSVSLADVRAQGSLMTVILHAELSGRLGIASQILRFLDEVIESGDVWIASAHHIADWWREAVADRVDI